VGALISAFSLVLRRSVRGLTRMVPISAGVFGAGLVAFGFSRWLPLSLVLMVFVGFGMLQGMTASNTIIQTLVPEDKRGRVMSYYTAAFVGMAPWGSLLAGSMAHWIGAPRTVMLTGSCCVAGGIWFWTRLPAIRREMRPIYERLGIIAPIPQPVQEQGVS
jgi:MFS family permease